MGGVLPYKWGTYCSTNGRRIAGFPFIRSLEARKAGWYKWGAYCRTNWRCIAVLFRQPSTSFGAKFSLQGKLGRIFPQRENFPSEVSFSLENSFPFPLECTVFQWNEEFGEKELLRLEGKFLTFPCEGKLTSSHFFASKDVMGTKSHNAAMSPLATRDGHRKRKRKHSDAVH